MTTTTENNGDASPDTGTQYALSVGDTFQGRLDSTDDVDWIRVELNSDTIYDIFLIGEDSSGFDLFDDAGNHVASHIQNNAGPRLTISPDLSGTYYIAVKGKDNDSASDYELLLDEHLITTGSYDEIADYLVDGAWEWYGEPGFAFDIEPGGAINVDITALTQTGQQAVQLALGAWAGVTGIRFEFVDDDSAQIIFNDNEEGNYTDFTRSDGKVISTTINVSPDLFEISGAEIGSYAVFVYMHEIGHALGLGHPGPYDSAVTYGTHNIFRIDSWQATIQSYFSQTDNTHINASFTFPVTPMIADIIAIQKLYGTPDAINDGDTVYGYQSNLDGYLGEVFKVWDNPFIGIDVTDSSGKICLIDLDADGDVDIVMGNGEGAFQFFENIGTSVDPDFRQRTGADNPLDGLVSGIGSTLEFADLDGDGDYDLVAGNTGRQLSYFENTGTAAAPVFAHLTGAVNPLEGVEVDRSGIPELADLDGDGDLDLIIGSRGSTPQYYENTGTRTSPAFTLLTGEANPFAGIIPDADNRPALADLDGDGDLDLILWSKHSRLGYYENTGTASDPVFTERSGEANPLQPVDVAGFNVPEFVDLDNDGDLDIVFRDFVDVVYFAENTGTGADPDFFLINLDLSIALTLNDRDGNDTLDLRTDTADQRINLRPEGISDVYGLVGNLVIARDTLIENVIAGSGDDVIAGNAVANRLEGRDGDDWLSGDDGDDWLFGDDGDDLLIGGAGSDILEGGNGWDTVSYEDSQAGVVVRLHADVARGGHAEGDTFGGRIILEYLDARGEIIQIGLPDIEHLIGSVHNDILAGDRRDNVVDGGGGDDILYGGPGGGDDLMQGGSGRDTVYGGVGDDRLVGGTGNDRLIGGPDADVFVFAPGDGEDEVTDFGRGADLIDLTAFELESMDALTITSDDDGVTIDLTAHGGGTILLAGVEITSLDATDFLF